MFRSFLVFLFLTLPIIGFADSKKALKCYYQNDQACLESELWKLVKDSETNSEPVNSEQITNQESNIAQEKSYQTSTRFYIGGGIALNYLGKAIEDEASYNLNQVRGGRLLEDLYSQYDPRDQYGASYNAFIGGEISQNIGVELGAFYLDKKDFVEHAELVFADGSSANGKNSLTLEARGVSLSGLFFRKLDERSSVYLRAGVNWSEQTRRFPNEPLKLEVVNGVVRNVSTRFPGEKYTDNGFGWILGVGSSFDLMDRYFLRAEVTTIDIPTGYLVQANASIGYKF